MTNSSMHFLFLSRRIVPPPRSIPNTQGKGAKILLIVPRYIWPCHAAPSGATNRPIMVAVQSWDIMPQVWIRRPKYKSKKFHRARGGQVVCVDYFKILFLYRKALSNSICVIICLEETLPYFHVEVLARYTGSEHLPPNHS